MIQLHLQIFLMSCVFLSLIIPKSYAATETKAIQKVTPATQSAPSPSTDSKTTDHKSKESKSVSKLSAASLSSSAASSGDRQTINSFQATSVQVEPFTGSANLSIPIAVPPGRAGIQPNLALSYSSTNRQLGLAGVGWSLELGSIQRSTKKGIPSYDDSRDVFVMAQGNSQELVADPNHPGLYFSEIEGSFARIQKFSDHWQVTDKKGTKYYFGYSDDSRQYDPANTSRIFRWALNRVEDIHGNYMTISYMKDQGQIYPQTIEYTGNAIQNLNPYAKITFVYQDARHKISSYISGFKIANAKIIDYVHVSVNGARESKYEMVYKTSMDTDKDLLASVQKFGSDDSLSLPAVTFDYAQLGKVFKRANDWIIPPNLRFVTEGRDSGMRVADVNADGYPDFLYSVAYSATSVMSWIYSHNQKDGWFEDAVTAKAVSTLPGFIRQNGGAVSDHGLRLLDANGDGYVDAVQAYEQKFGDKSVLTKTGIWVNNHKGLEKDNTATLGDDLRFSVFKTRIALSSFSSDSVSCPGDNGHSCNVALADVNGDGFEDVISTGQSGKNFINKAGENSNQMGWKLDPSHPTPNVGDFRKDTAAVDVNGDGLADIISLTSQGSFIYMNQGNTWTNEPNSPWIKDLYGADFRESATLADINGDRLLDLVITANGGKVLINTGDSWYPSAWSLPGVSLGDRSTQFFDVNGDGLSDYLIASDSDRSLYLNPGPVASDVLMSVNNGIGSQTRIEYGSSMHYQNTFLPFALQVVKSVTTTVANPVGETSSYTTRYEYAGGLWDAAYREFQGFKTVKVIDADGNYALTTFAQDHWLKGRPLEQASYDKDGTLYAKTVNQWQTQEIVKSEALPAGRQESKFVYLSRSDNYLYDGQATPKRTAQEMTFGQTPQYGDPTQVVNLGEVDAQSGEDIGLDQIITQTEYVHNPEAWVLGLPKSVTVRDIRGAQVAKSWFYYDKATDLNAIPSKGQLTKKVDWMGKTPSINPTSADPRTQYSYDEYGNLRSTTDPKGAVTSIVYDNTVHMFPVQTTNALNQVSKSVYYGIDGVPLENSKGMKGLWGQTMGVTDANNQSVYYVYDVLGRSIKTIGPLDNLRQPTSQIIYEQNDTYMKVTSQARVEAGGEQTIDTVSYYDGLGRLIQTKSLGPRSGQYIVSGQVEYNNRGLAFKQYLSFFTSNDLNTMDPVATHQPASQVQYDAMGRVVKSINPDGTYSDVIYDRFTTTSFDANGHMQKAYRDAFGRLVQKEEYTGADGRDPINHPAKSYRLYATTSYSYDVKGNLTSVMDAKGNVTVIKYDNLGRKISMDDPDMGHWEYGYDANGNLIGQKDAKNKTISFTYDSLNRLVTKGQMYMNDYSYSSYSNQAYPYSSMGRLAQYNYDDAAQKYGRGRLGSVDYGTNGERARFVYDQLGRETWSSKVIDNKAYEVGRQYDGLNRLKELKYPDGMKVKYSYNQAGQIDQVFDGDEGSIKYVKTIDYNAQGQMTQIEYGNGTIVTNSYDPLTKLLKRIYSTNTQGQTLQDLNYTHDALGQIVKIEDKVNTASQEFKYDELNRLIYAKGSYGTKTYAYDEIGNILQKDGLTYHYGEDNSRIGATKAGPHAVTSLSDGTVFKYDANGNMVNIIKGHEKTTYVYDDENRLTSVYSTTTGKAGVNVASYSYDGDGGRTRKVVNRRDKAVFHSKETTAFMYKDYNGKPWPGTIKNPKRIVTRYVGQLYEEEDPGSDGQLRKTKYIYLGSMRIAAVSGGGMSYYLSDHLGGTNVLTDKTGLPKQLTEYDPFGLIIKSEDYGNPSAALWHYFTGKPLDDETGLMYYGARYYNPKLGRFITPDTIVQSPGNPQTLNRYTYCNNNPVNLIDPTGHKWSWKKFWKGVGVAIAGAVLFVVAPYLAPILTPYMIGVVQGAIAGAAIGGFTAGVTGGNIGMGMLTGAIGGAIFGGIGGIPMGNTMRTAAHFAGGAASGAINGSIAGDNVGLSALTGGMSAGVTQGASNFKIFKMLDGGGIATYINNVTRRAVLGGLIGGGISASLGGSFGSGFQNGATTAAISYTANDFVHQGEEVVSKIQELFSDFYESAAYEYKINEGLILALAPEIKGAQYLLKSETWFARGTGVLNNNPYVRIGWGWNNQKQANVFRLAIGNEKLNIYGYKIHFHKDFWEK